VVGEGARRLTHELLFVGELEIHGPGS
jgi:hypothetical protein